MSTHEDFGGTDDFGGTTLAGQTGSTLLRMGRDRRA